MSAIPDGAIAVVGLACRFPGADDLEEYWRVLTQGVETIRDLDDDELLEAGVPVGMLSRDDYVRRAATISDVDRFDASFFYLSSREAARMDPQLRVFLQTSWSALEHSGHDSERHPGRIGVFAGSLASTYLLANVLTGEDGFGGSVSALRADEATLMGNDSNYLATRTSYHLNLTGPSIAVQSACSTSLVAVHVAAQSLLAHECDLALAGGVALRFPQEAGYLHEPDGILARDGRCRPFDAEATGTIFGNGVGVVVLKRLADAVAEGDTIWAVVRGSAVGNDGADRVGFTAPGLTGQLAVAAEALAVADVRPDTVGYIEAHGTGTRMGDPIELAALARAYDREAAADEGAGADCAIGSVKGNLGHLSVAAGIAGFIKSVLMLRHRTLVPTVHFRRWNPECDVASGRFWVPTDSRPWDSPTGPRRCAVHSTGMGGTTAHVVLEEAPIAQPPAPGRGPVVVPVSAKSPESLAVALRALVDHVEAAGPDGRLDDAAYTLATGRRTFNYRTVVVADDAAGFVQAVRDGDPRQVSSDSGQPADKPVVYLFPGQGAQFPGMGEDAYREHRVFREALDTCAELLRDELSLDLRDALYPSLSGRSSTPPDLTRTALTQPAVFAVSYAYAQLWKSWGVPPAAMIGHSVGQYVAACLAGVLSLPDALRVVAQRGRLVDALPAGSMCAVMLTPAELAPYLAETCLEGAVELAAVNEPAVCTVAGPAAAVRALTARLTADGVATRRVRTSHAFHSSMMEPAVAPLAELIRPIPLGRPRIPIVSDVTGTWLLDEQATDPAYWAGHLRATVRFAEGVATLLGHDDYVYLEVGPGQTLSTFTRRHPDRETGVLTLTSTGRDLASQRRALAAAVSRLWLRGQRVDWNAFHAGRGSRRVPLPTYPFERRRYWVDPAASTMVTGGRGASAARGKLPIDEWLTVPVWKRGRGTGPATDREASPEPVLLFGDAAGVGERLAVDLAGDTEVVRVVPGDGFGVDAAGTWQVRPDTESDYQDLVKALDAEGRLPRRILHAWSIDGPTPATVATEPPATAAARETDAAGDVERFENAQRLGLYSLIGLVKALSEAGVTSSLRLDVVSGGAFAVSDNDPPGRAELAPLSVVAKVVSQEHGNIDCRHVDLPARPDPRSVNTLCRELRSRRRRELGLAVRGSTRWVQALDPLIVDWSGQYRPRLRDDGVYLITGGLGEIGTTIAERLFLPINARLALLVREAMPPRDEWPAWLADHPDNDETSRRIQRVTRLESLGARLLILTADVADEPSMRAALARVDAELGPLNGVVHAAGLPSEQWDRAITAASVEQCQWHFVPKAHGQIVLERVLADRDVDFCLLLSSLAARFGGLRLLAYGAANHFMDAAAARANRGRDRAVWISVDWDVWQHHQDEKRAISAIGRIMDDKAIQPDEGIEIIRRVLALDDVDEVAVSTWSTAHRLDRWVYVDVGQAGLDPAPAGSLDGDLVTQMLEMIRGAVGDADMTADSDIFEHGGDSLLVVKLLARVRETYAVEVPLAEVLNRPTAAALAGLVDERLDARAKTVGLGVEEVLAILAELDEADAASLLTEVEASVAVKSRPRPTGTASLDRRNVDSAHTS